MDELGSFWQQETIIEELQQRLLCANLELEALKREANEEIKKSKENVNNLLNLLNIVEQERDEAKDQLKKLMTNLMPTSSTKLPIIFPTIPQEKASPFVIIPNIRPNSSVTESNSLSDTTYNNNNNHNSHVSSPVDNSLFEAVSSPDFSNISVSASPKLVSSINQSKKDTSSAIIDDMAKGKPLPIKGKLLQAVLEAGPLLQTLLVAGPLPQWRNPPPPNPFEIPPVNIINGPGKIPDIYQKLPLRSASNNYLAGTLARTSLQMCSSSMLNFNNGLSASCPSNLSSFNSYASSAKRQRIK